MVYNMSMNILQEGSKGSIVVRLQQFLNMKGFHTGVDSVFGPSTKSALIAYQLSSTDSNKCVTGIADLHLITLVQEQDKIDIWCQAIKSREGYFAPGENSLYKHGTPAWHNNNPGNLKWANQKKAYKDGAFAHFETYQDGYDALRTLLIKACTDQISFYDSNGSLLKFYQTYAPSSDNNDPSSYAKEVAGKLGVPVETPIKNLIV